ncbi:MAG TPA: Crp/Fnr family transcriptional regulator [Gammaproteobacteria bacterium]|nr:Crp/Fnr family transcriptional regulator [Gammaproteobacteria bacterium]
MFGYLSGNSPSLASNRHREKPYRSAAERRPESAKTRQDRESAAKILPRSTVAAHESAREAAEFLELCPMPCQSLLTDILKRMLVWGTDLLDLAEETDLLRKIPMFAKMETSKLKLLAFASEIVSFDDGDIVFNRGDSADFAYVIMEGAVDIVTETDVGPIVSGTLTQNQLIGELGLLNNAPRNATLITNGTLRVMKITGDMFFRILRENADVALDVIRMLSDKLSRTHERVEILQKEINQQDNG